MPSNLVKNNAEKVPWMQKTGESARAFHAFGLYRDLRSARSFTRLQQQLDDEQLQRFIDPDLGMVFLDDLTPTDRARFAPSRFGPSRVRPVSSHIEKWASKFDWAERCRAYEAHMDAWVRKETMQEFETMRRTHLLRSKAARVVLMKPILQFLSLMEDPVKRQELKRGSMEQLFRGLLHLIGGLPGLHRSERASLGCLLQLEDVDTSVIEVTHTWEQQKEESVRAFHAFQMYRQLGTARSLSKVQEQLDREKAVPPEGRGERSSEQEAEKEKVGRTRSAGSHIERWSRKYHWVERCKQWDSYLLANWRAANVAESRKCYREMMNESEQTQAAVMIYVQAFLENMQDPVREAEFRSMPFKTLCELSARAAALAPVIHAEERYSRGVRVIQKSPLDQAVFLVEDIRLRWYGRSAPKHRKPRQEEQSREESQDQLLSLIQEYLGGDT